MDAGRRPAARPRWGEPLSAPQPNHDRPGLGGSLTRAMHSLLQQQLEKFCGSAANPPAGLAQFVEAINESYKSFDRERELLHRAMDQRSQELTRANSELCTVFQAIPDVILRLDREGNTVALKATEPAGDDPEASRFSKRQIISKISNIPDPAIREKYQRALAELLRDRQPKTFEYSINSELGEHFFEVRLMPLLESEAIAIVQDISKRKAGDAQSERLNLQLISASRQAGMAEVAIGVLHNVGNVLNSVNVSATLLRERVGKSQINNLVKAANLLREHEAAAASFLTTDPKGQRLPGYLIKLGDHLAAEQTAWQRELEDLGRNIEHIREIVSMQQSYAKLSGVREAMDAEALIEDALRMNASALNRHGVKIVREFQTVPLVGVDKHKVLQILINLIHNAKDAMDESGKSDKTLSVKIQTSRPGLVGILVCDSGSGIAPENLDRIFQHGFTTKPDGHGFGLHSSANAAREMGGDLTVQSGGPGQGASFTLELPFANLKISTPTQPLQVTPPLADTKL